MVCHVSIFGYGHLNLVDASCAANCQTPTPRARKLRCDATLVPLYTRVFRPQTITRGPIPRHHDLERPDLARLIAVVRTRHGPIAAFVHRPAAPDCVSRQKKPPAGCWGLVRELCEGKQGCLLRSEQLERLPPGDQRSPTRLRCVTRTDVTKGFPFRSCLPARSTQERENFLLSGPGCAWRGV